jgi:hypothetical protein
MKHDYMELKKKLKTEMYYKDSQSQVEISLMNLVGVTFTRPSF